MNNLKNLCYLLIFSFIFANCSAAQKIPSSESLTKTVETSDRVNPVNKKFESNAGNFSINISQTPSQTRDLGTDTANKKGVDVGKIFIWQFPEKALYTVMYKNAFDSDGNPLEPDGDSKSEDLRDLESLKLGMRRGIVNNKAKLLSENSISFNNYPGTEFRYTTSDGVKFIGRIYSVNSIGYQIVGGYKDDEAEKEVLKVLDSFKLLTETNPIKGK